jgi:hypothetical protein
VLDREFPLEETAPEDLMAAAPRLQAAGAAMWAWPETGWLGRIVPAAALAEVAVDDLVVRGIDNRFPGPGCEVAFVATAARANRLVLLDAEGRAQGLAVQLDLGPRWLGWWRGAPPTGGPRVVALR